ncbi:MAG: glycoside hydrolase family 5 protein [Prevotella sp.]|jgi:hypothetical protein|nr:glycoside hydrolase family 5 protein [Prevotella sp.]
MKKRIISLLFVASFLLCFSVTVSAETGRQWTVSKVDKWYSAQPWLAGCCYIPATAINQIEMWSADTYDAPQINKELGWAQNLGFNTLRVFLSSVVWQHDPVGFKNRMNNFLNICKRHKIRPFFVFFDDCWDPVSYYGRQPAPKPGVHNSGWVQDPMKSLRADTTVLYPFMKAYVQDILKTFKNDKRVLMWDLYNEPGNSGYGDGSLPRLEKVFEYAREVNPSQPLTAGIWIDSPKINHFISTHSDVITFHCYAKPAVLQHVIDTLRQFKRPLICSEYMARPQGSTFQKNMPVLKENHVGAINWGFVSGKTNTIFAWNTPLPDVKEPKVWFHDIFRQDGTPYDPKEIKAIKSLTRR